MGRIQNTNFSAVTLNELAIKARESQKTATHPQTKHGLSQFYSGETVRALKISSLGPVVQSIVSLTTLLRRLLLKLMLTTLSNTLSFLLEKCENLLHCKRFSHFSNKK